MRYLLDTGVWLWSLMAPERIREEARLILADGTREAFLSAASSFEISLKWALGKLPLPEPPARYIPDRMAALGIEPMPVTHAHALDVSELPRYHTDPFDRLLISQARVENMVILTADRAFRLYPVKILWCGQ